MKKQNIMIFIITATVVILFALVLICIDPKNKSDNNYESLLKGEINIYKYNENRDEYCLEQGDMVCKEVALTIEVNDITTAKGLEINKNYLLYRDSENVILYDLVKKEQIKKINLSDDYSDYNIFLDESSKAVGIVYSDDDNNGYYNIETDEVLYENKYDELEIDRFSALNDITILIGKTKINDALYKKVLLDINQEKELIVEEVNPDNQDYNIIKTEKGNYYLSGHGSPTSHNPWAYDIYSKDLKKIASNIDDIHFHFDLDENLYVYENNVITKYDVNGNKIYSKNLGEIIEIAYNYVIKVKDNNLVLVNINDETETKLTEWKDTYYYNQAVTYKKDGKITITVGYNEEHQDFEAKVISIDVKTLKIDIEELTIGGY